jgi:hypothetical protein
MRLHRPPSHAPGETLFQQYWLADVYFFVLTKQGRWIGWGYSESTEANVHMNGQFVDLTRITSQKTKS